MSFFSDRIVPVDEGSVRSQIIGLAQGAGLKVTNWRIVSVGTQIVETMVAAVFAFGNVVPAFVRGFASLDTSTDPGDEDLYDLGNVNLTPDRGFLSVYGENTYGTVRGDATFASGIFHFTNAGPGSRTIGPQGLIFTQTGGSPPSPAPTYTNTADATIYTNPDGTLTIPAGGSADLPIQCQVNGSIGSAPASTITLTTTLNGCGGTNANPLVGNDREDAEIYRERCRQADARLSFAGPADSYSYFASKTLDGSVLLNDGVPPVPSGISRTQVTQSSSTGIVNAYFASDSGGAIAADVSAANRNIRLQALVVPDAITYTGVAATTDTLHVVGTAKIKARIGVTAAAVAQAIVASLVANGKKIPIGGVDQVAGAGVVYTKDLERFAGEGFAGIYDVAVSTPAGLTTNVAVGHVTAINSVAGDGLGSGDWTITLVS